MRQISVIAAASVAAFGLTSPAAAQEKCFDKGTLSYVDCPQPAPAPAPAPIPEPKVSWTGWYLGVHAGYGQGDIDSDYFDVGFDFTADLEPAGALVGGHLAYLHHFDNDVVLGLEIDGSATFFDDDRVVGGGVVQHDAEIDYLASARVKLGYAIDTFMPYATGGVALVSWDYDLNDAGAVAAFSADDTTFGGVVGGGFDYMWTENWIIGAEGLYYLFEEEEDILIGDPGNELKVDDVVVGRFRITYKF